MAADASASRYELRQPPRRSLLPISLMPLRRRQLVADAAISPDAADAITPPPPPSPDYDCRIPC